MAFRPSALQTAHLSSSDTIYDLECGDGGVIVTAASQYGARGWCFDIYILNASPKLVSVLAALVSRT